VSTALVIGEALVDEIVTPEEVTAHPGGSPFNVAVGLARLGAKTTLHTAIGDDERGALLRGHAEQSGLTLTPESVTTDATSSARATIGPDGAAAYDFSVAWRPRTFHPSEPFGVVHSGSIAAVMQPGSDLVLEMLARARSTSIISLDPNMRPALTPDRSATRKRLEALLRLADVVKASDEDIAWLHPGDDPADVAARWLKLGPALVIVTRGAAGAATFVRDGSAIVAPVPASVVDTIGAGDSFMAGLLSALVRTGATADDARAGLWGRRAVQPCVEFAARCAAVTVGRSGADLPWADEVPLGERRR
jgi:fructokinase